ncbi:MAG: helix-turn-helix transcriptional regulator [Opitutus sp.]|nr:helix-turn-helix transcriptional regulator [Opitutus sp.]MCS6273929.1 helix-turn-helix transcriptional regulator [Opitutus sp.]MCS6276227.1 helix-turn-helix transcriptional regulator [Opitutus sp.]
MARRQLTGVQLAVDIGLSETSLSRIVTGHAKPKQVTLTRLMKRLCTSTHEEQMILRAFTGPLAEVLGEEALSADARNPGEERERVERWLEARTQAITFKNAVGRELDKVGVTYRRDACEGIASVDFLIEAKGKRVGIECKFNVGRDFEKTVGIARRLRELLRCDLVIIAVPFEGEFAAVADVEAPAIRVFTAAEAARLVLEVIS